MEGDEDSGNRNWNRILSLPCFTDRNTGVAFVSYALFVLFGVVVLFEKGESHAVQTELVGIFAEVAIIGFITVICQVPAVSEDETKAFLTQNEVEQLERVGTLDAPYVLGTNLALNNEYEEELRYMFPSEFDSSESLYATADTYVGALNRSHFSSVSGDEDIESKFVASTTGSISTIANGKSIFGDSVSQKEHQKVVSSIMNGNPTGWDNCWFVAALGMCDRDYLGTELLSGLLTCISGSNALNNRFTTQAALTSLGNLYFGTKHPKISRRIIECWKIHEISSIRDHCVQSIQAIGHPATIAFVDSIVHLDKVTSEKTFRAYFEGVGCDTSALTFASVKKTILLIQEAENENVRLMSLIGMCVSIDHLTSRMKDNTTGKAVLSDIQELVNVLSTQVLLDPFEYWWVQCAALELLSRLVKHTDHVMTSNDELRKNMRSIVIALGNKVFSRSVFKSVRVSARALLHACKYDMLMLHKCFESDATQIYRRDGISSRSVALVLKTHLPNTIYSQLQTRVSSMTNPKKTFTELFSADSRHTSSIDHDPVLLLYTYLSIRAPSWIPNDVFVLQRMNSPDWLERFCGVLSVARFVADSNTIQTLRKEVIPRFYLGELISNVRDVVKIVMSMRSGEPNCLASIIERSVKGADERRREKAKATNAQDDRSSMKRQSDFVRSQYDALAFRLRDKSEKQKVFSGALFDGISSKAV